MVGAAIQRTDILLRPKSIRSYAITDAHFKVRLRLAVKPSRLCAMGRCHHVRQRWIDALVLQSPGARPSGNVTDFYSVAIHELGPCVGLRRYRRNGKHWLTARSFFRQSTAERQNNGNGGAARFGRISGTGRPARIASSTAPRRRKKPRWIPTCRTALVKSSRPSTRPPAKTLVGRSVRSAAASTATTTTTALSMRVTTRYGEST